MTNHDLVDQIARARGSARLERVLERAAGRAGCLEELIERVRSELASAPASALRLAEACVQLAARAGDARGRGAAYRVLAQAHRVLGRHEAAVAAFDSAAEQGRLAGDPLFSAQAQIGKVDSLGWTGRYDEAISLAGRLEEELRALGSEADAAKVLVNAGSLHFRRDEYAKALACYERALGVLERSGDAVAVAQVKANCANVLTGLNRGEEAMALFAAARAVFAEAGLSFLAAITDGNLAYLKYISGEHSTALALWTRARQEFVDKGLEIDTAKADLDTADAYRALNLFPEALECYNRALAVFGERSLEYERGRAELGRASVLSHTGEPEAAFDALDRADRVFRAQRNRLQRAHVRLMRSVLLLAAGHEDAAREEAAAAMRSFARQGQPGWAAEARYVLAERDLERGAANARQMGAVSRAARANARGWLECRAERALGRYYTSGGDNRRGLFHLRRAVRALEAARTLVAPEDMHVAFLRDKLSVYEDLVRTLVERGSQRDLSEALEYVERSKSRLLLERVQASIDRKDGEYAALRSQIKLADLRARLSRAYHLVHSVEDGDARRLIAGHTEETALPELENEYRLALRESELAELAERPDRSGIGSVVKTRELARALGKDETVVEYYQVDGTVFAFLIGPEHLEVRRGMASADEVNLAARRLRYHLQKAGIQRGYTERHSKQLRDDTQDALNRLYDLLLLPLEGALTTEKLVIVPHGGLHGLPFHAFFDGSEHALDRWEISYAPSAAVWYAGRQRQRSSLNVSKLSALLVGVPSEGIERVQSEVDYLAQLIEGSRKLCGEEATVSSFFAHAPGSDIIHLATHAVYRADNPLFSGLQFSDGWLLARDLYDLHLDCDLATLSACHTGVASVDAGDELFGLVRGFLFAGARTLAVSLWPADDKATSGLMGRFYRYLADGKSKAAALREAQRAARAEYAHPYFWAAFALIGEP